jgi:hypothetical protein
MGKVILVDARFCWDEAVVATAAARRKASPAARERRVMRRWEQLVPIAVWIGRTVDTLASYRHAAEESLPSAARPRPAAKSEGSQCRCFSGREEIIARFAGHDAVDCPRRRRFPVTNSKNPQARR